MSLLLSTLIFTFFELLSTLILLLEPMLLVVFPELEILVFLSPVFMLFFVEFVDLSTVPALLLAPVVLAGAVLAEVARKGPHAQEANHAEKLAHTVLQRRAAHAPAKARREQVGRTRC